MRKLSCEEGKSFAQGHTVEAASGTAKPGKVCYCSSNLHVLAEGAKPEDLSDAAWLLSCVYSWSPKQLNSPGSHRATTYLFIPGGGYSLIEASF